MGWGSRLALAAVVGPLFLSPRPDLCISNVKAVECSVLQYPIPNAPHYVLRPSCFLTTSYVPGTSLESTTKHGEMPTCNIDSGSESRRGTIASLLPSGRFYKHFFVFVFVDNVDNRSHRLLRRRPIFFVKLRIVLMEPPGNTVPTKHVFVVGSSTFIVVSTGSLVLMV